MGCVRPVMVLTTVDDQVWTRLRELGFMRTCECVPKPGDHDHGLNGPPCPNCSFGEMVDWDTVLDRLAGLERLQAEIRRLFVFDDERGEVIMRRFRPADVPLIAEIVGKGELAPATEPAPRVDAVAELVAIARAWDREELLPIRSDTDADDAANLRDHVDRWLDDHPKLLAGWKTIPSASDPEHTDADAVDQVEVRSRAHAPEID